MQCVHDGCLPWRYGLWVPVSANISWSLSVNLTESVIVLCINHIGQSFAAKLTGCRDINYNSILKRGWLQVGRNCFSLSAYVDCIASWLADRQKVFQKPGAQDICGFIRIPPDIISSAKFSWINKRLLIKYLKVVVGLGRVACCIDIIDRLESYIWLQYSTIGSLS